MLSRCAIALTVLGSTAISASVAHGKDDVLVPILEGHPWQVAGQPDLGQCTDDRQQPVDFGVWQAADGKWQLWSCIRNQKCGDNTRLFHRWEGGELTDRWWKPKGIAMQADTSFGETSGGLQAPHVVQSQGKYHMFYGDWKNIARAESYDGKTFARVLQKDGKVGMYSDGGNTRDPMLLRVGNRWISYTTAHPGNSGAVYARTTRDFKRWSKTKIVAKGGAAGDGPYAAECPHVYHHRASGYFYLFRTQKYGEKAHTTVYRSKDPLNFGVDDDRYRVTSLPIAAPEIIEDNGQVYVAYLNPGLDGIRIQKLGWTKQAPKSVASAVR